jgi:hypothetical protein
VLGVGLALIGLEVYLMVDALKRIRKSEVSIDHATDELLEVHRRIDTELSETRRLVDYELERLRREITELNKYVDSRIDKTEFKLTEKILK